METYRARYPGDYGSARRARHELMAFASRCGFSPEALIDIESAAGEAIANAAEHGACRAGFEVVAGYDGMQLSIEVKDDGAGFDSGAALAACPDTSGGRGYGIFLMRALMDELVYSDAGTRIRLVKRRLDEQRISYVL